MSVNNVNNQRDLPNQQHTVRARSVSSPEIGSRPVQKANTNRDVPKSLTRSVSSPDLGRAQLQKDVKVKTLRKELKNLSKLSDPEKETLIKQALPHLSDKEIGKIFDSERDLFIQSDLKFDSHFLQFQARACIKSGNREQLLICLNQMPLNDNLDRMNLVAILDSAKPLLTREQYLDFVQEKLPDQIIQMKINTFKNNTIKEFDGDQNLFEALKGFSKETTQERRLFIKLAKEALPYLSKEQAAELFREVPELIPQVVEGALKDQSTPTYTDFSKSKAPWRKRHRHDNIILLTKMHVNNLKEGTVEFNKAADGLKNLFASKLFNRVELNAEKEALKELGFAEVIQLADELASAKALRSSQTTGKLGDVPQSNMQKLSFLILGLQFILRPILSAFMSSTLESSFLNIVGERTEGFSKIEEEAYAELVAAGKKIEGLNESARAQFESTLTDSDKAQRELRANRVKAGFVSILSLFALNQG